MSTIDNTAPAASTDNTVSYTIGDKDTDFKVLKGLVQHYGMLGVARMLTYVNGIGQGRIAEGTPRHLAARAEKAVKEALREIVQNGEFRYVRAPSMKDQEAEA